MLTLTPSASAQTRALPVTEFAALTTATEGVWPGGQFSAQAGFKQPAKASATTTAILFITVSFSYSQPIRSFRTCEPDSPATVASSSPPDNARTLLYSSHL